MTAPRLREQRRPPSPPDRRPPRRGGGSSPSPYTYASAARRGLVRSARALATAALLALAGALALPATAQAQTATTLVSNIGQSTNTNETSATYSQRFTTGSNAGGYTLTGVDIVSGGTKGFTAKVCGVDSSGYPTSTCTDLMPPGAFAAGTLSFTPLADATLMQDTTYAVVASPTGSLMDVGRTSEDGEDMGFVAPWSIANEHDFLTTTVGATWQTDSFGGGRSMRIAIKGTAVLPTPVLSVADAAAVTEGSPATFTVTLTPASTKEVTVQYSVGAAPPDQTATTEDFTFDEQTLTFAPGETMKTVTVATTDDALDEADEETFHVNLSHQTNATFDFESSSYLSIGTINDNDAPPTLSAADVSAEEGDGLTFTVPLSAESGRDVTVAWAAAYQDALGDTAEENTDFTPASGTLTFTGRHSVYNEFGGFSFFATGETSKTFTVSTTEDLLDEANETFTVTLSNPTNAGISDTTAKGTITNDDPPAITGVEIASTPVLTSSGASTPDTYGLGETIEISVTFSAAVAATADTDFVLSVSGAKRAALLRGSGTQTLVFGYAVQAGDEDDNGIWIGDQDRTLVGDRRGNPQNGAITSVASGLAVALVHSSIGTQSDHKVDGSRSIVSVAVSSTPMLETDTYGGRETIRFTVTFNAAVNIGGDPVFRFSLGNTGQGRNVDAAYESGTGTTALVFGYTVQAGDSDDNGIWIGDQDQTLVGSHQSGTITIVATGTAAGLAHAELGAQSGHKVDGSRTTSNNPPTFDGTVTTREVPENSAADTEVSDPVTATDDDDDTLTYTLEGTDAASFTIDSGTGQIKTVASVDYNHEAAKNTYQVTVKADDGFGGTDTIDVTINVTDVNEQSAKPAKPTLAKVTGSSTSLTATWTEPDLDGGPAITGYKLEYREGTTGTWMNFPHSGTAVTTTITGLTADTEYQVQVHAENGETPSDWSDPSDAVGTNRVNTAPSFTSPAAFSAEENAEAAGTVEAEDGDTGDGVTGYAITGGVDQALFEIGATDGALSFKTAPNFEDPQDQGAANTYEVTVQATSGAGEREKTATQTIAVTVTDAAEKPGKPAKPTLEAISGSTTSLTATWTKPDLNGGPEITGYDVQYRQRPSGAWTNVPHAGMAVTTTITGLTADMSYQVRVRAKNEELDSDWSDPSDAEKTTAGPPVVARALVTSGSVGRAVRANFDQDLDQVSSSGLRPAFSITADGAALAISRIGRVVQSDHSIDIVLSSPGQIYRGQTVVLSYDRSAAGDRALANADGTEVEDFTTGSGGVPAVVNGSTANDPSGNNAPSITSQTAFNAAENARAAGTVEASDSDTEDNITGYAITGGEDQALFDINGTSGALTFKSAPDFEDPQDQGADNTYEVTVQAISGTGTREKTATQTIAVTVTNADEGQSGTVTVDDTSPMVGDVLTASAANVADPDGLPDPFAPAWRWYRTPAAGSETEIPGAALDTYTVVEADLGATLTAKASWTDKGGFANALASAPTSAVADSGTLPTLSVADAEGAEDEGVEFTVTLSAVAATDVTATWTASIETGDTASTADLATTKTGTVTVDDGETTAKFTVPVNDDNTDEPDQTFTVTLSNPSPTSLAQLAADPTATGTIKDDDSLPVLQLGSGGTEEATVAALLVTVTPASEREVMVTWTATIESGNTAEAADFTDLSTATGTGTIPAGRSQYIFFMNGVVADDSLDEDDEETYTVTLSDPVNATLSGLTTAIITIDDDDPTPTVTVADGTASEGDKVEFVVTLSAESGRDVEVDYATSVGTGQTATSGTDFTAASSTLTIEEGDETGTIEVQTTEDSTEEEDETFTLTISDPANATLGTKTAAKGTIEDRATAPTITAVAVTSVPVLETDTYGAGETIRFTVTFSAAVDVTGDPHFAFSLLNGEDSAPYESGSGTRALVFGYTVVSSDEDDDGIFLFDGSDFTNRDGAVTLDSDDAITAAGSTTDADLAHTGRGTQSGHKVDGSRSIVSVAVSSTPMLETDTYGVGETIRFTVTFSSRVSIGGSPVFRFSLGNLGVGRQVDAAYESGAGSAALVFGYTVVSSDEDDDGIWIGHQGQTLVGTHQTGTITIVATSEAAGIEHDALGVLSGHKVDGSRSSLPTLSIRDDSQTEGSLFVFVLLLSEPASEDVPVTCTASFETGDTAVAGDLTFTSADGRIQSGQNRGSCSFRSMQDSTDEEDETFTVTLSSTSSNAQLASDPTAKGTINDDDDPPTVSVADVAGAEGEDLVFTVALSAASGKTVTVAVATSVETGDTATSGTDFTAVASTTLTFDAGQEDKTVTVQTTEDATEEENETFTVTLSGPTNATLSTTDATAKGTIIDDDATVPTLSVADAAASEGDDLSFAVTLSAAAAAEVTATWTASIETGDTAVAADLGSTKTGTVTVAIGDTDATITVATAEDTTVEVNETFTVTLSGVSSNAQLSSTAATAQGTINNDDAPAAPTNFAAAVGNAQVTLSWAEPASGSGVTRHEYRQKEGTGSYPANFTPITDSGEGGTNQFTVMGLTNETAYTFELRSVAGTVNGAAAESDPVTPTPGICGRTQEVHETIVFYLGEAGVERTCAEVNVADLAGLTSLEARDQSIASLKLGDFAGLTSLISLELDGNSFTTLPAGVFSGLTSLTRLQLDDNDLSSLPAGVFSGLALGYLDLNDNDLGSLPAGLLSGLTGLEFLNLGDNPNTGDTLALTVTVEKSGTDQARAKVLAGAPAAVDFTATVVNGSLPTGVTKLAVAAGEVDGTAVTVTRTAGAMAAVTVDIDLTTQPTLPTNHTGYTFAKATSGLPATILPDTRGPQNFTAKPGDGQAVLSWTAPASGSGVTKHQYRQKEGTGSYPANWTDIPNSAAGGANEDGYTVPNLTNETVYTFELRSVVGTTEGAASEADPVTPTPGICDRTQKVHEIIVYYLEDLYSVERTCAEVNVADLERFTQSLDMPSENIGSLKSGDFAGLSNLVTLNLAANTFTTLPADVFSGLTSLTDLVLNSGALSSIDARAFSGLTTLTALKLELNDLTVLPANVFSGLTALKTIDLQENDLTMLPANVFSGLSALVGLTLNGNDLGSLPPGLFSGLSALSTLHLHGNELSSLPAGLFSGLSALTKLQLHNNDLSSLPDGLLSGLRGLSTLKLGDNPNTGDTLALTVTVEKFGTDQARAKVPAGAPAAVAFTPTVVNGSLPTGVTKLAVAAGSVDGTAEKVTRTTGTVAAVTVDIDLTTQPTLPTNHSGYEFEKAASGLPATILPDTRSPQNFTAKPGDGQAVLSWDAPASGSGVTRHDYRYKSGTGSYPATWEDIPNSAAGGANEDGYTVTNLTNETVYTFELRTVVGTTEGTASKSDPVTPTPGICDRTQQVQDGILAKLADVSECEAVTVANLAGIGRLDLDDKGITSLKAGDFAGLTGMTTLILNDNDLTSLPAGVFSGLTALSSLFLVGNDLSSLPATVFSGLTSLGNINLRDNDLNSLPANVFSGLTSLWNISLRDNDLSSLPATVFSGLTSLINIDLLNNDLTSLPDGLFSGLTGLEDLVLGANPNSGDELPLTVTLEKVGEDRVRAKVLAGAPFAVAIPVTPANGTLAGGVTMLTVAAGSVESAAVTVTRTEGTTAAVTVDVDLTNQPSLPPFHLGYFFARAPSGLPAVILPEEASLEPPTGLAATPGDQQAVLTWTPPAADSGYTRHQYRYRTDGDFEDWTDIPDSGPSEANASRYPVTDLANAVEHTFELRARDAGAGKSDPATVKVTPAGPPRILGVVVTSGPGLDGDTYGVGEAIRISVTFDQPVEVTGDPELALDVGGPRLAEWTRAAAPRCWCSSTW